jgi:hypothetical protein
MSALIRNIFRGWARSESFWDKDGMDDNLRFIGDHLPLNIVTINGTRPTYGATEGDCHIYTSTGRYSVWSTGLKLQQPSWNTYQPSRGLVALHAATGDLWGNTGSAWVNLTASLLNEEDVIALIGGSTNFADGTNTTVTGTGSIANPRKVNVATATDTVSGVSPLAVAANYPSTSDTDSTTPAYVAAAINAIPEDPVSTMAVVGVNYVHTDELDVATVIQPGQFLSPDLGNAMGLDAQGRLKVLIPAQLPDDQVLSGDNSGTVALVLTPTTDPVTGDVNYTIKADLKLAATTPSGAVNMLKYGASGFYVEPLLDVFE